MPPEAFLKEAFNKEGEGGFGWPANFKMILTSDSNVTYNAL